MGRPLESRGGHIPTHGTRRFGGLGHARVTWCGNVVISRKDNVAVVISMAEYMMIIGHQAVNRMILSDFLFRRAEDVPYIFIPQDKYFHIVSTQTKKLFELKKF